MYDYRIVEQVTRKKKPMSGALSKCIAVFAFIFVMLGIMISQAFMLSGFLLAGLSAGENMSIFWIITR